MAWLFLFVGGILEICFALSLKASDGFSKPLPTVGFVVFAILSFACVNLALRELPIGTAYAVWTGIGAAGAVVFGILLFNEPANALRLIFVATIVGGIAGLQLTGAGH